MDDSKLRFGVGVLVIAAIGIGVILTFLFGAFPAILNREYSLTVQFPSAEGINANSPVLRDGVKIGRVSAIQLRPTGGVDLMLAIDAEHVMSHQYIPQIGIGSLITGDSKLEFRKASPEELDQIFKTEKEIITQPYTDGEQVAYGMKLDDPFSLIFGMEDELRSTFQSIRGAGESVENVGNSIQTLVQDVRGLIGIEPTGSRNPVPPAYPPGYPNQSFRGASVQPASYVTSGGGISLSGQGSLSSQGLPPGPAWARPVVLTATETIDPTTGSMIRQVAFVSPNQNQFAPPKISPPSVLAPGVTPPLRTVQSADAPTFRDLQDKASRTLDELQNAIRTARLILEDEKIRQGLPDAIGQFPELVSQARNTLEKSERAFDSIAEVGKQFEQVGSVAEQAITELKTTAGDTLESFQATAKNVEAITEPIGRRSEDLVVQVLRSLANLDNALLQLDTFGQALNNSDGTVKQLLDDDELYYEIRRTVQNIEAASARVRPILDDVRVFTDKIARDPGQLGVRGALDKRPRGAGLK